MKLPHPLWNDAEIVWNMSLGFLYCCCNISSDVCETYPQFLFNALKTFPFYIFNIVSDRKPKWDVENCSNTFMAFFALDGYSCKIEIQNSSSGSSAWFILSPRSLERDANFSSLHNANLEESVKGLRIQSNPSTLIEGKYSSALISEHVKCSTMMGIISFTKVLRTNGNMSKVPAFTLLFHKITFFVKATHLSIEVRIFSFLPCVLLLSLLSCPYIFVKYSNLNNHISFLR